ncbi:MAG: hypothetical protein WBG28_11500 [Desulfobulbales bacterium]
MRFGAVVSDHLTNVQISDKANKGWGNQNKEKKCGDCGSNGPKRDVTENIETCK